MILLSYQKLMRTKSSKISTLSSKFIRTAKRINPIKRSKNVVIDKNERFIVDGTATGINVPIFFYDLQQPTKNLSNPDYFKILEALNIKQYLVINSNAKIVIRKRTQTQTKKKEKTISQKRTKHKKNIQLLTGGSSDTGTCLETSKEDRTQHEEKNLQCFDKLEKKNSLR